MTQRAEILRTLIETGYIASSRTSGSDDRNSIVVTVCQLRRLGYSIKSSWGNGYSIAEDERVRLAADPWVQSCIGRSTNTSVVITLPADSMRVLACLAEEQGKPLSHVAAAVLERGLDAEMGA